MTSRSSGRKKRRFDRLKKEVSQHNRRVRRKNATFEQMTKAEKRVQLAKDVLEQLGAGKLKAMSGVWLTDAARGDDLGTPLIKRDGPIGMDAQVRDLLATVETCNACALGSLLLCTIKRVDKLTVGEVMSNPNTDNVTFREGEQFWDYLREYFSNVQLALMEKAFERGGGGTGEGHSQLEMRAAHMFQTRRYGWGEWIWDDDEVSDDVRLSVIMENVIKNDGTFKPRKYVG